MTAIVDAGDRILGVFTDGDLRRAIDRAADLHRTRMDEVMTRHVKTVRAKLAGRRGRSSDGDSSHHVAHRGRRGRHPGGGAQRARLAARPASYETRV